MRITINPPTDHFEIRKYRAHIQQALREYGVTWTGKDTATTFDVTFPASTRPEQVQEFLSSVGAVGAIVEPGDVHALVPAGDQAPVRELLAKKLVDAEVCADELLPTVQEWRDSLWVTPTQLDEAQEQAAYEKTLEYVPQAHEDFLNRPREAARSDIQQMLDDNSEEFRKMGKAVPPTGPMDLTTVRR